MTEYLDWSEMQTYLDDGKLALLPTETVYGLAGNACSQRSIDRIYAAKGRDDKKPLAIVVRNLAQAETLGVFNDIARELAEKFWPGALTLVLNAKDILPLDRRTLGKMDGKTTIALRCPDTKWRTELWGPLALTSANQSGQPDMTSLEEIDDLPASFFEHIYFSCEADGPMSGKATTIVRVSGNDVTVLRQGELDISP